jgi:hypothetical protein
MQESKEDLGEIKLMNVNIGDKFRAQEPWNFGKKNPFIAPQEN